jgi:8-oxo-dGTP diphosphatase
LSWSIGLKIVIGFIENEQGQIYVTRRALNSHLGGYWELPGGKLEPNETCEAAIQRELKEELNIDVQQFSLFNIMQDKLEFHLYDISYFTGEIKHCAGQLDGNWISLDETHRYLFPQKNIAFFTEWKKYKSQ